MQSANLKILASSSVVDAAFASTGNSIRFSPQGLIRSGTANTALNGILRICLPDNQLNPNSRDIEMRSGGRTRVVSNNVAESCPAPANPV
jgi:type IV fimbrial biogenesis protein FimT